MKNAAKPKPDPPPEPASTDAPPAETPQLSPETVRLIAKTTVAETYAIQEEEIAALRSAAGLLIADTKYRLTGPVPLGIPLSYCSGGREGRTWLPNLPDRARCSLDHSPERSLIVGVGEVCLFHAGHRVPPASHWTLVDADAAESAPSVQDQGRLASLQVPVRLAEAGRSRVVDEIRQVTESIEVFRRRNAQLELELAAKDSDITAAKAGVDAFLASGSGPVWREKLERSGTPTAPPPRAPSVDEQIADAVARGSIAASQATSVRGMVAAGTPIDQAIAEVGRVRVSG